MLTMLPPVTTSLLCRRLCCNARRTGAVHCAGGLAAPTVAVVVLPSVAVAALWLRRPAGPPPARAADDVAAAAVQVAGPLPSLPLRGTCCMLFSSGAHPVCQVIAVCCCCTAGWLRLVRCCVDAGGSCRLVCLLLLWLLTSRIDCSCRVGRCCSRCCGGRRCHCTLHATRWARRVCASHARGCGLTAPAPGVCYRVCCCSKRAVGCDG